MMSSLEPNSNCNCQDGKKKGGVDLMKTRWRVRDILDRSFQITFSNGKSLYSVNN